MRTIAFFTLLFLVGNITKAQIIAKVQMTEEVEGICDHDNVYGLFDSFEGQVTPKCSVTKEEMEQKLNEVQYLKDHPKSKGKGMVGVYINCKGEPLNWDISIKIEDELDKQLLLVFQTFKEWSIGTLDGEKVDCRELISYKIKKGKLTIN